MTKLSPLKLYLHILQLEGYNWRPFLSWVVSHITTRSVQNKKPLVWTSKANWLWYLSLVYTLFIPTILYVTAHNLVVPIIFLFALLLAPFPQLLLALATIKPYEVWNKAQTIGKTREKIASISGLRVIGVTGSYGKTSTKEFLYQLLKDKYKVLRTPESYNTVFGIAKVVDLELDESYDFFICEMGAYQRGEIVELCQMVGPRYGILTGIAEQHLERFGSLENIISGKFELVDALPEYGFAALNTDNKYIRDNIKNAQVPYWGYGKDDSAQVRIERVRLSEEGSRFVLVTPLVKLNLHTKLVGLSNVQNIAGAVALSLHLGVPGQKISRAVANLEPVPNRLEILKRGEMTILNDSYNSNPEGFREAVETADLIKSKFKVLITPGIVDLGARNHEIHKNLGKLSSKVFDLVILVTDSVRTRGLEEGLLSAKFAKEKIVFADTLNKAMQALRARAKPGTLVLLENDLPDNY